MAYHLIINIRLGLRYYFAGNYAMAIEAYRAVLELNPDFAPALWHLGWAYEQIDDYNATIASAERAFETINNPIYLASLGHAHGEAGNEQDTRRVLDQL